jgi:hypothetical protein
MAINMHGQVAIQATAPGEDPIKVGSIWIDTSSTPVLKICTSISPYTFAEVSGGAGLSIPIVTDEDGVILSLQPTGFATDNGSFNIVVGRSENPIDGRPDDTVSIGWNNQSDGPDDNSLALSFETHCSDGTGCVAPQGEIFFTMSGPLGTAVRPLGMFQQHDGASEDVDVIARAKTWTFYDQTQTNVLFQVVDNKEIKLNSTSGKLIGPSAANADFIMQAGACALKLDTDSNFHVSPTNTLRLGSADYWIKAEGELRLRDPFLYNLDGDPIVRFGNGGDNYVSLDANDTDTIAIRTAGASTNVNMQLIPKGSGTIYASSTLKAEGFQSSDGSDGMTGTVTLASTTTLIVKNGLIVGTT